MVISTDGSYALLLLLAGAISAFTAGVVWRRREAPGARYLLFFSIGSFVWSFTYAAYWVATPAVRLFWLDLTYLGVVTTPWSMAAFILCFIHRREWIAGWKALILGIIPALTLIVLWTDPWHGWFYGGARSGEASVIFSGGPWFWVNAIYSYGLIVMGVGLLLVSMRRANRIHRGQARLVLAGILFPILSNILSFAGLNPFPNLDLTPLAFTFTGVFLTLGLFSYRLLDLTPIGRDVLVENMSDGMLLFDEQARIVDINPAARVLLNLGDAEILGRPAIESLAEHQELILLLASGVERSLELTLKQMTPPRYLMVKSMPVYERGSQLSGQLMLLHDITQQKVSEHNLKKQLDQIAELQTVLQEQALRDSLTGLFNRRYLEVFLPKELAMANNLGIHLSVVMLDIDHFKKLNDRHGHLAGDAVLLQVATALQSQVRDRDIVCRFGGEEFLVVLPGLPMDIAYERVEALRARVSTQVFLYGSDAITLTLSAGVAGYPEHGQDAEALIFKADEALYQAKNAGRDRTCLYDA